MDWTTVINLIDPKLFIVVAACWVLGYILKQTPKVPDWSIVYVVTVFSLAFAVWMVGFTPAGLLQGLLCGAVAVYGNQLIKQAKKADGGGQ